MTRALAVLAFALVACSGSGSSGAGGGGGTSAGLQGTITVTQSSLGGNPPGYLCGTSAIFFISRGPLPATCTASTLGGCSVVECALDGGTGVVSGPITPKSAGDLTLTGPRVALEDGGVVKLTYKGPQYLGPSTFSQLWDAGDTLSISAAGDAVPAFSEKTVIAPGDLALVSPGCNGSQCDAVSRAADLAVSWTGVPSTPVEVKLQSHGMTKSVEVTCLFSSSPGTVGSAAMATLNRSLATDTGVVSVISVTPVNTTTFNAGDYGVSFSARGSGVYAGLPTSD